MRIRRSVIIGATAAVVLGLVGPATFSSAGTVGTNAGFEGDDGNLAPAAPINFDWNSFSPTWIGTAPTKIGNATASGWTFKGFEDWQVSTDDSAFAGGTKQDDLCPKLITQKAPNKDDLKRIYLASKTGADGHTYLSLAWIRIPQNTTSPSAHVAFEFNKATNGKCANSDLVNRVAGDMLVVYDFEGGTDAPVINLSRWVTDEAESCEVGSHAPPCWGTQDALDATEAEAKVNTDGAVSDEIGPDGTDSLGTKEFGEATIDLTAAGVFAAGKCEARQRLRGEPYFGLVVDRADEGPGRTGRVHPHQLRDDHHHQGDEPCWHRSGLRLHVRHRRQ